MDELEGRDRFEKMCLAFMGEGNFDAVRAFAHRAEEVLTFWSEQASVPEQLRIDLWAISRFLDSLKAALDPEGNSAVRMKAQRRAGRPQRSMAASGKALKAAAEVQKLVDGGRKQEAAIADVAAKEGIGRTEIFRALRHRRAWEAFAERLYRKAR